MFHLNSESFDDETFSRFCKFIHQKTGIVVNESKKTHLSNRLRKRVKELRLTSFKEYWEYLSNQEATHGELFNLFDAISTNETYFQRGLNHYKILRQHVLPDLYNNRKNNQISIWSCGTSTGEEAYDLAMISIEFENRQPGVEILITGTDISHRVIEFARNGEYADRRIDQLSTYQVKTYFEELQAEKSSLPYAKYVLRVKELLRKKVVFHYLNLVGDTYLSNVDVIFCRNVLIYFDRQTQQDIVDKFSRSLNAGGYLFIGPTESLQLVPNDLTLIKTPDGSVYKKET